MRFTLLGIWLASALLLPPLGGAQTVPQHKEKSAARVVRVATAEVPVSAKTATVHLVPDFDLVGAWADFRIDSFRSRDEDLNLAARFQGRTATKIPYGIYDLRISHRLGLARRRVDVFQPDVWVIFGIETYGESAARGPRNVFTGTIENINPDDEPVFVRAMAAYFDYSLDGKVTVKGRSGTFYLGGRRSLRKILAAHDWKKRDSRRSPLRHRPKRPDRH
jgi:hypothetical protein